MTKRASSPTIPGIEKLINQYYYSTSYTVDPITLQISNKNGLFDRAKVEFKKGRYIFSN